MAAGDRGRHVGQHHRPVDHRRVRPDRAERAAAAVHRALLRGDPRRLGAPVQRGGADRGGRLYPSWDISEEALAAADTFLGGELPSALRRLVLEGRAGYRARTESARLRRWLASRCEDAAMAAPNSRRARAARRRTRRVKAVVNDLTEAQWAALKAAWNGCAYCGVTGKPLQRDCVMAISRGGRYTDRQRGARLRGVQCQQVQ